MNDNHYLVPPQHEGLEKDLAHSIAAPFTEDAEDWFVDAKERLLAVNNWQHWSGLVSPGFKLTDSRGSVVERRARKGDHIRIDLPEGGFDWVAIEAIEYDDYPDQSMETFAMRVRPSTNPMNRNNEDEYEDTADKHATSTFVIERRGKRLTASYHGRNEADDMDAAGVAVASCAWLGLDDVQCAALIHGFVV